MKDNNRITLRAVLVGAIFSAVFAALSIYIRNTTSILMASTQIAVLPYLLLIFLVLLWNPCLRLIRLARPFALVELMIIFIMAMVSAGIPNFGLVEQILPLAGSFFNREWNSAQSEWDRYLLPFINDAYFVGEKGLHQAAADYYARFDANNRLEQACRTAERLVDRRQRLARAAEELQQIEKTIGNPPSREEKLALRRAQLARETLAAEAAAAERAWADMQKRGHPDPEVVLREYPERIAAAAPELEAARARLVALEEAAFAKVEQFRRGLPRQMRAFPGIFPLPGDNWAAYSGRLWRLREGYAALAAVKAARVAVVNAPSRAAQLLAEAEGTLAPLAAAADTAKTQLERLTREDEQLLAQCKAGEKRLMELNEARRRAHRRETLALDGEISAAARHLRRLEEQRQKLLQTRECWNVELERAVAVANLSARIAETRRALETGNGADADMAAQIAGLLPDFAAVDISLRRYLVGELPWHHWARPLFRWAVLMGLTYLMLMTLNVLIFRQWAHNEMLTYPLAELPKALVCTSRTEAGIPDVFHNGLFWMGAALSGAVLGWNLLCKSQVVPGLTPLNLSNSWSDYVINTPLQVLMQWKSEVFFTMVGLAFLIPKNISFSLWFFYLVYMVQLLIMYWSGYIDNEGAAQWWYLSNIKYAEGGGAMFVFAAVVLFKCRRYLLCAFNSGALRGLAVEEQRELRVCSWLFLLASVGIILQLWLDMGANLFHTLYFYIMILLVILAMMRAVAEGGILGVKTYINPFHVVRAYFGFDKSWTSAALFTPLLLYIGILFVDLKVFIAPAMANALKLRDDFRMRRGAFHLAVAVSIVLAVVVATLTSLFMCYDRGADGLAGAWFYVGWPRSTFGTLTTIVKNPPDASLSSAVWMAVGAVFTAAIIYLRQFFFWVPHPIGLVMLVNPIMQSYWFSIFLGWLANSAITKYGHKNTFVRASGFFIGLIMGELLIVILSVIVSLITGHNVVIDLNRN